LKLTSENEGYNEKTMTGTTYLWTPATTHLLRSCRTGTTCPLSRLIKLPAETSGFGPAPWPTPGHWLNHGASLLFWASRHEFCDGVGDCLKAMAEGGFRFPVHG